MEKWPLLGRARELEQLATGLRRHRTVFVVGAAGTGKSRLVRSYLDTTSMSPTIVAATEAAREVPLGAFAPVLPDALPGDPFDRLQMAGRWLTEHAALLVVDDAHLLDAVSAGLLHQVIGAGTVPVVATVRSDATCDAAVTSLWSSPSAVRLHLEALDRATTATLAQRVLAGPITPRTEHTIWERTRGNPLALRELVTITLEIGALRHEGGVWRLDPVLELPRATAEVIASRVSVMNEREREAFELIALGEPLPLAAATELGIEVACEALETKGLLVVVDRPDGPWLRPHHPLHGEAVRAMMPKVRRARHRRTLADIAWMVAGRDPIRAARWQLEADVETDPALLHRAAIVARGVDGQLVLRLATAAVDRAPTPANLALLAQAAAAVGDGSRALELVRLAAEVADDDTELAELAVTATRWIAPFEAIRAPVLACVVGIRSRVGDGDALDRIETELAAAAAVLGRRDGILPSVARVMERSEAAPATVLAAVSERIIFGLFGGRTDGIDREIAEAEARAAEVGASSLLAQLAASRSTWFCLVGRITDAVEQDRRLLSLAMEDPDPTGRWMASTWLAVALELAGSLQEALTVVADAGPLPSNAVPHALRHFQMAVAATVHCQLGAPTAARAVLDVLPTSTIDDTRVRAWISRVEVWLAALDGDLDAAEETARQTGDDLEQQGWMVYAVLTWFDLVRLGRPVPAVAPLLRMTSGADASARMLHLMAEQAVAAADGDGPALDVVAAGWAAAGSHLVATEAAGTASILHARSGRPDLSARSAVRAETWFERCPGASTPALLGWRSPLTDREREVARIAAAGGSSRDLAERLHISVRTVDNHLASVYRKVGITGRAELVDALGMTTDHLETPRSVSLAEG